MSATVLYISISLDGFIAGPKEGPDNGLGDLMIVLDSTIVNLALPSIREDLGFSKQTSP